MKQLLLFSTLLLLNILSCKKESDQPNKDENVKGCGDFIVAKIIEEDKVLTVWIDAKKVSLSTSFQQVEDIAKVDFAQVEIEQNCDVEAIWFGFCNDVFQTPACPSTKWTLQKGKLSFKVNKVPTQPNCRNWYLATVILENAQFTKDSTGQQVLTLEREEIKNVQVGWCAG